MIGKGHGMNSEQNIRHLEKKRRRAKRKAAGKISPQKKTGIAAFFCKSIAEAASALLKSIFGKKRNVRKYGQGYTEKPVPVESIGTFLKKKDGMVKKYRYVRKPNGQIVKEIA